MAITQPRNETHKTSIGTMEIKWSPAAASNISKDLNSKQKAIDAEVIRLCDPLVPKQTGALAASARANDGVVEYVAPYARAQYYGTAESRSYDTKRGGKWFQRMKTASADQILQKIKKEH